MQPKCQTQQRPSSPPQILYEVKSLNHIKVIEELSVRKLIFAGAGMSQEQSAINVKDLDQHIFDYSILMMYYLLFIQPVNVLVIGLGGAVIPRQIRKCSPSANIDIIEIDPEIVKVAKNYFFFEETDKTQVYVGDAFRVIPTLNKKYDVIILDAFSSSYIPFHLMSEEFFKQIANVSSEKSVIISNTSYIHPSFYSQINTMRGILSQDIYSAEGTRNFFTTILYFIRGGLIPANVSEVDYGFTLIQPEKMVITEEIKSAKIFRISDL